MTMNKIEIRKLPQSQRAFDALPMEERSAIVERSEVKEFLTRLRSMKGQARSVAGAELTIPVVFLDLIAENMFRYSKLLNRVRMRNVGGQFRQTIAGTVPEAVWTEMCGAINELTLYLIRLLWTATRLPASCLSATPYWMTATSTCPATSWRCCPSPSAWLWTKLSCTARVPHPRCPWAL